MAKLSLSEVSKRFNVSRSTLYRAIKEGRISRSSDGLFDIAEVIRCFGEPGRKAEDPQILNKPSDDADLRQLVDFMKKEIESYKDREQRYLDQIDRFQLLLGHKESTEKVFHGASEKQSTETPHDNSNDTDKNIKKEHVKIYETSNGASMEHLKNAPQDNLINLLGQPKNQSKKRSLFGRVLNAVLSDK